MNNAVKMVAENGDTFTVGGYGLVWGGQDVEGERFTKDTDFWFDRLTETPMVLYRHGREAKMQRTVVGAVTSKAVDDFGLWIEAQIKDHEDYSAAIRKLVNKGVLGWSSGAVNYLVDKVKKGGITTILSWPVAEFSLVPDPMEPRTVGVSEIKSLSPELAETIESLKTMSESSDSSGGYNVSENSVGASGKGDFAYVDSNGRGHLPVHDAAHVRAAMSRFDQTDFESPAKKKSAARKILSKASALNIDVSDDSAVSAAAKAVKDLPDGPTMMADGPYPEGSYEDLTDDIRQSMCKLMGGYCYVQATFPGYALVVCNDEDEGTKYLRVAYTVDAEGEPVLGEMESVTPAMIPLPVPMTDEAPLAIQSARLSDYAELVTDRTKAVSDRRIKEGRVLSTANRERLTTSADTLEEATKALRDLLIETTEPAEAVSSVDRLSELALLKLWGEALA